MMLARGVGALRISQLTEHGSSAYPLSFIREGGIHLFILLALLRDSREDPNYSLITLQCIQIFYGSVVLLLN